MPLLCASFSCTVLAQFAPSPPTCCCTPVARNGRSSSFSYFCLETFSCSSSSSSSQTRSSVCCHYFRFAQQIKIIPSSRERAVNTFRSFVQQPTNDSKVNCQKITGPPICVRAKGRGKRRGGKLVRVSCGDQSGKDINVCRRCSLMQVKVK